MQQPACKKRTLFFGTCKRKTLNKMERNTFVPNAAYSQNTVKNREFTKLHLHFVLGPIYSAKQIISFVILYAVIFGCHEYFVFCQKYLHLGNLVDVVIVFNFK